MKSKRSTIASGTAKHASHNVLAFAVSRFYPVGDGKTHRSDVIRDDTKGDITCFDLVRCSRNLLLRDDSLSTGQGRVVRCSAQFLKPCKNRLENVRLIIRDNPL